MWKSNYLFIPWELGIIHLFRGDGWHKAGIAEWYLIIFYHIL